MYYIKAIEIMEAYMDSRHAELAKVYRLIGIVYAQNNQFEESNAIFRKYEKLFPDKPETLLNWAGYYAIKNMKRKAIDNVQKAIELGFADIEWLNTNDSINNIRNDEQFIELIEKINN